MDGTRICELPPMPLRRAGHTLNGFMNCGGDLANVEKTCITLSAGGVWEENHQLDVGIFYHTSWTLLEDVLLIGGALTGSSTLLLKPDSSGGNNDFQLNSRSQ